MEEDPGTFWNIIGGIAALTVVLHSASGQGGGMHFAGHGAMVLLRPIGQMGKLR